MTRHPITETFTRYAILLPDGCFAIDGNDTPALFHKAWQADVCARELAKDGITGGRRVKVRVAIEEIR